MHYSINTSRDIVIIGYIYDTLLLTSAPENLTDRPCILNASKYRLVSSLLIPSYARGSRPGTPAPYPPNIQ